MNINKIVLAGRLTADPELKKTKTDKSVVYFTVAVNRGKENADFIDCVAFDKTAENICKYFAKGYEIGVFGSLTVENYTTKDGNRRKSVKVSADGFSFGAKTGRNTVTDGNEDKQAGFRDVSDLLKEVEADEDLPF